MAVIVNGILGGFSGKVGTVIGGSWKGIDYIRALASSVVNPQTPAQQEQRLRFSLVLAFLRPLTMLLRVTFATYAVKMTAFNAAMSYNVKNAISGLYPDLVLDYTKLLVARGPLAVAIDPTVASTAPGVVDFDWIFDPIAQVGTGDHLAIYVAYNPEKAQSVSEQSADTRATETGALNVPAAWSGDNVQCYIAFIDPITKDLSDGIYIGPAMVA